MGCFLSLGWVVTDAYGLIKDACIVLYENYKMRYDDG